MKELRKSDLVELAKEAGLIETEGKTKAQLIEAIKARAHILEQGLPEEPVIEEVVEEPTTESVSFKKSFTGCIAGKWYRVPGGLKVDLPKDVVGRFRASGIIE